MSTLNMVQVTFNLACDRTTRNMFKNNEFPTIQSGLHYVNTIRVYFVFLDAEVPQQRTVITKYYTNFRMASLLFLHRLSIYCATLFITGEMNLSKTTTMAKRRLQKKGQKNSNFQIISIYFHDAKAQGEAVKDHKVPSVYRTQMQLLTIHEQKD